MHSIINVLKSSIKNPKFFYYYFKRLFIIKRKKKAVTLEEIKKYIKVNQKFNNNLQKEATVVIPVYNGINHLKKLIPSLIKNTDKSVRVIILDDCSSDPSVNEYLKDLKIKTNFEIYKNKSNLGFVKSINILMSKVKTKYAIWLNSDTKVPNNWVNLLLQPFDKYKNVASTTPFSNSATIFSFPKVNENNKLNYSLEKINKAFSIINDFDDKLGNTVTGVGFCMGISMEAWNKTGKLNEILFDKGYGEENDWCFRASKLGYKHKIAPNLFVSHYHGGSFGKEKEKICDEHIKILRKLYPNKMIYEISKQIIQNKWFIYKEIAINALKNNDK